MNNELEHPGSESPVMVTKPPKRSFTPLLPAEKPAGGRRRERTEVALIADEAALADRAGSPGGAAGLATGPAATPGTGPATDPEEAGGADLRWKLTLAGHGPKLLRGLLVPQGGDGEAPPERSWAIEELPPSEPGPEYALGAAAQIVTPGVALGGWQFHPEALRFVLTFDETPQIYGLGEKMGRLERSGRVWEMWNTDDPFHLPSKDPLYVSVPFALFAVGDEWIGFFLDAPARHYWDTRRAGEVVVDVEDSYLDFYLIRGEGPKEIIQSYTDLTGRMALPPLWALGYHQSRYSYYPETNVRELARRFRSEQLPGDVIHLDIDYMDGYRVFTWDGERFPDPRGLIEELRELGFRVVTIVDPGVKVDEAYEIYAEGEKRGYFCRYPDGRTYVGRVWPGEAVFPDFSREEVRSWWAAAHKPLFDAGVSGVWNDMNEPADFSGDDEYRPDFTVPCELIAENEGSPVSFRRFHNLYGSGMNLATREALDNGRPRERGFLLTRSGYAGIQRRSAIWTGDNHSWWEHLAASVAMLCGMGVSGLPFVGADAGGFQDNASPELFARWIAAASMTPFFRGHSVCDSDPHEPWSFGGKTLDISRKYLRLRYALLPYIYTAFRTASLTGLPVMAPLFLNWPEDERARLANYEHLFGPDLLVAPVVLPDQSVWPVYLPGGVWYDYWSGERLIGPADLLVDVPLDKLPLFVRGGAIIPREEPRLSTEEPRKSPLYIDIYPDREGLAEGELYVDAGEGWEQRNGAYTVVRFRYADGELSATFAHLGYEPPWADMVARLGGGTADSGGAIAPGREVRMPFPLKSGSWKV